MSTQSFANRVGIVTGAGKGIGQACAIAAARAGARLILNGQSEGPLAPGAIETPLFADTIHKGAVSREDYQKQTPMNRIARAEEVAAAATWLCSDAASYVTGALLPVEGGMTL
jgi:3-oxoacyl-[acyl-carrier protein] reductase